MDKENVIGSSMSDFTSIAVHQLKVPLVANKWALSDLKHSLGSKLNEAELGLVEKIYESNERAINLAEDILKAEAEEAAVFEVKFSVIDISELIKSILRRFEEEALEKKIKIEFKKPEGGAPLLSGDKEKLSYVFENIIGNAMRYTGKGGRVTVEEKVMENSIQVLVVDTGIGIPVSEQGNIFQKFFRGGNLGEGKPEGSGLGLFISKNIVEKHGGSINFQSREGEGTVFTITLPLRLDK